MSSTNIDLLNRALADFAVHLYQKASESIDQFDNVFLSPFSVAYALAMAYAGSATTTKEQMKKILFSNATLDDESIHNCFANVMQTLNKPKSDYKLLIANRLYANKSIAEKLLEAFVGLLTKKYASEMHLVNFEESNGEVARKEINDWVSGKTNDKINDLIPSGVLNEDTRLVLVNAIYFKGDWLSTFDEKETKKESFYAEPNTEIKLDTMHKRGHDYEYTETDECQVLGISYQGQELSMFIFLPKDKFGLQKIEKAMTGEKILEAISKTKSIEIEIVALPKFKLLQQFSLSDALKQMGAIEMFTDDADFSNITGKKDLRISDVIHKAFIEVNEKGTEAAAATAVVMVNKCMCMHIGPQNPPKFIADHPFMFCIFDERSKSILFFGRYTGKE